MFLYSKTEYKKDRSEEQNNNKKTKELPIFAIIYSILRIAMKLEEQGSTHTYSCGRVGNVSEKLGFEILSENIYFETKLTELCLARAKRQ